MLPIRVSHHAHMAWHAATRSSPTPAQRYLTHNGGKIPFRSRPPPGLALNLGRAAGVPECLAQRRLLGAPQRRGTTAI